MVVTTEKIFVTILSGYFPVIEAENARKYIQYFLRFPSLSDKNHLADNRNPIFTAVTEKGILCVF